MLIILLAFIQATIGQESIDPDHWECPVIEPLPPPRDPNHRSAHDLTAKLWTDSVVPYLIDDSFNSKDRETLAIAIQKIEEATCVRFKELSVVDKFENFVKIRRHCDPGSGDWCFVGGWVDFLGESRSSLSIGNYRLDPSSPPSVGLVVHELLHNLGMVHTQKRPDRNDTIKVLWDNLEKTNLAKAQYKECFQCKTYGTQYDCMSIMHYRDYFFSFRRRKTMVPVDPNSDCDLNRDNNELTRSDKDLINAMYCGITPTTTTTTTTTTIRPLKSTGEPCCTNIKLYAPDWVKDHIGEPFTGTYLLISQEGSTEPRYRYVDGDRFQEIVGEPLQGTIVWWITAPGRGRRDEYILVARQMRGLCLSEKQPQQWYDQPKGKRRLKALDVEMRCLD
jgi:hypothetical protein